MAEPRAQLIEWVTGNSMASVLQPLSELGVETMSDLEEMVLVDRFMMAYIGQHPAVSQEIFQCFVKAAHALALSRQKVVNPLLLPPYGCNIPQEVPSEGWWWLHNAGSASAAAEEEEEGPSERLLQMMQQLKEARMRREEEEREAAQAEALLAAEEERIRRLRMGYDSLETGSDESEEGSRWRGGLDTDTKTGPVEAAALVLQPVDCVLARNRVIKRTIEHSSLGPVTLDLVFVLDCTSSMGPYIEAVKDGITSLANWIKKAHCVGSSRRARPHAFKGSNDGDADDDADDNDDDESTDSRSVAVRVAFVGYRDYGDDEDRIRIFPLSDDVVACQEFISMHANPFGGDDGPEDVLGGLQAAADLDWQGEVRILYQIGDAPCHGSDFHDGLPDNYPGGDPNNISPEHVLRQLRSKNIEYYFGRIQKYTDKMIARFNTILRNDDSDLSGKKSRSSKKKKNCAQRGSEYIKVNDCREVRFIVPTISRSVFHSLSFSGFSAETSSAVDIGACGPAPSSAAGGCSNPLWAEVTVEAVEVYRAKLPSSVAALKALQSHDAVHQVEHRQTLYLKVGSTPVAAGHTRRAHKALEFPDKQSSFTPSTKRVRPLIVKYLANTDDEAEPRGIYQEILSNQVAAIYLAQEFNKVKPRGYPEIHFAGVWLINHLERGAEGNPWGTMEEVLEGNWEKYNNNNGMVALLPGIPHEVCQAFSHWTWHVSRHDVMVVDIQGTYEPNRNRFFLTDPAIHCKDPSKFGSTNLAQEGMEQFFKSHVCNDCCRAMKLPPKV